MTKLIKYDLKMNIDNHVFGGEQTRIKLSALAKYLPAYTTALSKRNFRLNYVDAFAGTGACHVNVGGNRHLIRGSASIAIECQPPFDRLFFIEAKRRYAQALQRLQKDTPDLNIEVIHGDANTFLPEVLQKMAAKADRAVVFLDPYGMSVELGYSHTVCRKQNRRSLVSVPVERPLSPGSERFPSYRSRQGRSTK